jgi:hypothetical protein
MIPPGTAVSHLNHSGLFPDNRDAAGSVPHKTAFLTKEIDMTKHNGYVHPEALVDKEVTPRKDYLPC